MLRSLVLCCPVLFFLLGCSNPVGLTIHNSLQQGIEVSGLPGGAVTIDAGQQHRVTDFTSALELQAKSEGFSEQATVAVPPPRGEALWSVGGKSCFVLGDFTSYYELPANAPASASVVTILSQTSSVYVSDAPIDAPPGHQLPRSMRGSHVRALVEVPCKITASEEVARGWLEMTLDELQPR